MTALGTLLRPRRASPSTPTDALCADADGETGIVLATRLGGERALPLAGARVVLSPTRLTHHLLVCGATGSGKTETLMRLAYTVACSSQAPVFYLDGKGDRDSAERFVGLMAVAGRHTRVFPHEPFDGWRGAPHELHGRLMEVIDYANEGPASWYRDVAKSVLRLVCEHPDGPPSHSGQLLARMDHAALVRAHPHSSALAALSPQQVQQTRLRYEAFLGQLRGRLDGGWAWEDTPAAYLLLDSLTLKEETAGLARFLFEDFAHYFTTRKPRGRFAMLIVDEFSALASASGTAARIEEARGFNTGLVLAPQVVAGMGDRTEAERILGSVETTVCHRMNTPEDIIALAGTKATLEYTTHYRHDGPRNEGTARIRRQPKIDPNHVRALPAGQAFLICHGRAMRAAIHRAPLVHAPLPPASTDEAVCSNAPSRRGKPPPDLPF
jgi:hypothetical protein